MKQANDVLLDEFFLYGDEWLMIYEALGVVCGQHDPATTEWLKKQYGHDTKRRKKALMLRQAIVNEIDFETEWLEEQKQSS